MRIERPETHPWDKSQEIEADNKSLKLIAKFWPFDLLEQFAKDYSGHSNHTNFKIKLDFILNVVMGQGGMALNRKRVF